MAAGRRFYEVDAVKAEELAMNCRAMWGLPANARIGPVNTNYHATSAHPVRLVVVCESPSFAEVKNGSPAWEDTGVKILNRWRDSQGGGEEEFEYRQLEENGIYVTNLVRCQADWVTADCYAQGARLMTTVKDERVRNAWPLNSDFLAEELRRVAGRHQGASVLFACGSAFKAQVREATKFAEAVGLNWMVSFHPSRLAQQLSWHYNPQAWGENQRTFPSQRNEKNRNEKEVTEAEDDSLMDETSS
ncbi:uracil-DNA glycosylase family protein [Myxococcus landrumensis]|uniref:Uracil-DNA glycosylase-like domain-containing protein n=1 Tax=Myxococcus landrumensis TaxID=2813577 RepID=A0ABX7MWY5_9BACT|nr:uracil-DNA glycosylase family protein [Myxococcus landrumus]QSQ10947.1 hypothetical protein JY572_21210 [Myxococcus landrumus]